MSRNRPDLLVWRAVLATALLSTGLAGQISLADTLKSEDFAGLVDIGDGRKMYLECHGAGSPPVILISGLLGSTEAWRTVTKDGAPKVFPEVAKFTRVCAYDRPGTPVGEGPSRSDPVPQPTSTQDAATDLYALLHAAPVPGPYVLVAHSYGGLVARLYASRHPGEVSGMVLIDALSDGFKSAMTPEQWTTWKTASKPLKANLAEYPELEQLDYEASMDQVAAAPPIHPMPLVVLSADFLFGPNWRSKIVEGVVPPGTPSDLGYVIDKAQKSAQEGLAALVPDAKHVTNTHSGHNIPMEQPQLVIDAIREVVDDVRSENAPSKSPDPLGASR
jgi:pimeloyl-ACP methyl ester carboxylesterase